MRFVRRRPANTNLQGLNKGLSRFFMLLFFIAYWIFVWQLEGQTLSPPQFWQQLIIEFPLLDLATPLIIFVMEMFSLGVLRHLIPVIAGWFLARLAIIRFLESFYDLPDSKTATSFLNRFLSGKASGSPPSQIKPDSFERDRKQDPLLRIGGPGHIIVSPGNAVVTERNGRFLNVFSSGKHSLSPFEFPVAVVDLRQQERESDAVNLVTSDGIELTVKVGITFQINVGDKKPSKKQPYPYESDAVRKAAYAKFNLGDKKIDTWESLPLMIAAEQLAQIVAEQRLDELVYSDRAGIHIHQMLKSEMERKMAPILRSYGLDIISLRLGRLELPDSVTEKHISYWRAHWDKQRLVREAEGKAKVIEETELARAEAEAIMVKAIVEGMNRARQSGMDVNFKEVAALRLLESMENLAHQSKQVMPLPDNLLPVLSDLQQQLQPGVGSAGDNNE